MAGGPDAQYNCWNNPLKILVVDAEADLCRDIESNLAAIGYDVKSATDAGSAIEVFSGHVAQVAIIDIHISHSGGLDLISALMAINPELLCVITAVQTSTESAIKALSDGAYAYMNKPLDREELGAMVQRCQEKINLQREKSEAELHLKLRNDELIQINRRLTQIVETTSNLSFCSDIHTFGPMLLKEFSNHMLTGGGSLYVVEQDGLRLLAALDPGHAATFIPFPLRQGSLLEHVLSSNKPLLINERSGIEEFQPSGWDGYEDNSVLIFPVPEENGKVAALINLHNKQDPPFIEQDKEIGSILASYCCEALRATRTSRALLASEEQYRAISENSPDAIMRFSSDYRHLYVNPAAERLLGIKTSEIQDRTIDEAHYSDHLKGLWRKKIKQVFNTGQPQHIQFEIIGQRGLMVHDWRLTPELDHRNQVSSVLSISRDITELKQIESALRESEEFNRAVIESSPLGITVRNRHGKLLSYNQSWKRIWAMSDDAIIRDMTREREKLVMDSTDKYLGSYSSDVTNIYQNGGTLFIPELKLNLFRTGAAEWVSQYFYAITGPDGEVDRVVVITDDISDRKRAEIERQRQSIILESTSDIVYSATPDYRLVYINQAGMRTLGLNGGGEPEDNSLAEIYGPKALSQLTREWLPQAIKHGTWTGETMVKTSNGNLIPVSQVIMSHKSPVGELQYFSAILRDITEEKQAVEDRVSHLSLLENLERVDRVIRQATQLDSMMEEMLELVNEILGCDRAWLLTPCEPNAGQWRINWHKSRHGTDPVCELSEPHLVTEGMRQVFNQHLNTNEPVITQTGSSETLWDEKLIADSRTILSMALYPKTGKPWLFAIQFCSDECHCTHDDQRLFIETGRRIGDALGSLMAIHDRQRSERRYKHLVEMMAEGIVVNDADENILFANPRAEEIFGAEEPGLTGRNIREFLQPDQLEILNVEASLRLHGETTTYNIDITRLDGQSRSLQVSARPQYDDEGNYIGALATLHDITDRLKLEQQLRQAQKMEAIGGLAGGIAHDFNNLLFAIIGNADLAQSMLDEDDPVDPCIQEILVASNRAKELVEQILSFARKTKKQRISVPLKSIAKEVVRLISASLPSTIKVDLNLVADHATVLGDPTEIHQVLLNLCTNAGHAMMESGGVLEIIVDTIDSREITQAVVPELKAGNYAYVVVRDTGSGISQENLDRIFEPYFTTREKGQGTGMGLAVVHGIVTNLDGAISVTSEVDVGTTFEVFIPLSRESPVEEIKRPVRIPRGTENILVVDDETAIASMVTRALISLGYTVTTETDSQTALATFRASPRAFDLVFTDQTMPGMTGGDLAREILAIRNEIPVVMCTGYSQTMPMEKALEIGISEYVQKPLTKRTLAEIIRTALDKSGNGAPYPRTPWAAKSDTIS